MAYYTIPEFYGIQQHKDGSLLPAGSAYDARNMDTSDGNLATAKGYAKHITVPVPGTDQILKIIVARSSSDKFYVLTRSNLYAWNGTAWATVYAFFPALTTDQVDVMQTKIGTNDCLVIATGETQMLYVNVSDNSTRLFGCGLYSLEGTVSAYDSSTLTITPSASLDAEAQRRCKLYGVSYADTIASVASCTATSIVLKTSPVTAPASGDALSIRGGGSSANVKYLEQYYSRLFAAGDPDAPSRLYWSVVVGDGRTIEDWLSVDGSYDASGGYVDIGESAFDDIIGITALSNQILIFKRFSVWRLYGDRPSTFTVERIDKSSDTVSNAGIIVKYDSPYFLMPNGIHYYDSTTIVPVDSGVRYLRRFIDTVCDVSCSKGIVANNRFYLSCKVDAGSAYDDAIIVYDISTGAYMIRDGFCVADMLAVGSHIYMINENRYVYEFEKGDTYDGSQITAYWRTQPTDLSKKLYKHQITGLFFRATGDSFVMTAYGDDQNSVIQQNILPAANGFVSLYTQTDYARLFSFLIENEAGSKFSINGGVSIKIQSELKE